MLLIGDSLARMWLPAFMVIARRESLTLTVAAFPSCPWQPEIKNGLAMSPPCPGHRADWYRRFIPQLHPDIVVVAERGYDEPGNPFSVSAPGGEVPATSTTGQQALIGATTAGIQSLRAPGRQIVLLQPTPLPPDLGFEPVSCLSTGSTHCAFRVSTALTSFEEYLRRAGNQPDVTSLDLDRLACPRYPVCDPVVNDIIVRRDHTHLTATYRALARRFARRAAAPAGRAAGAPLIDADAATNCAACGRAVPTAWTRGSRASRGSGREGRVSTWPATLASGPTR